MTNNPEYKHVATLCHASSNTCPEVYINESADEAKQVKITDDFGGEIYMSREQLSVLRGTEI